VFFPRQLAPTVGPTRKGVEIQEGTRRDMEIPAGRTAGRRRNRLHTNPAIGDMGAELVLQIPVGTVLLSINQDDRSVPAPLQVCAINHEGRSPDDTTYARTGFAQEAQQKSLVAGSRLYEKTRPGRDR